MSTHLNTPKGNVTIRLAVAADAARLRALRLEALVDAPVAFAADYERSAAEPVERWVQRINEYAQGNQSVIYVAEGGEGLVGMTGLGRGHWRKTEHGGVIWGVYVQPAWRGLHIAEALIEACIAWGQALGMTVVKLGVVSQQRRRAALLPALWLHRLWRRPAGYLLQWGDVRRVVDGKIHLAEAKPMSKKVYAVLGGGRQGTAAAYDMAKWGEAEKVLIGDIDLEAAQKAARRVNQLRGRKIAEGTRWT